VDSYVADEENLFRLSDSRASDGSCVMSTDQVYGAGQTFRYGRHMWYVHGILYSRVPWVPYRWRVMVVPYTGYLFLLNPRLEWNLRVLLCIYVSFSYFALCLGLYNTRLKILIPITNVGFGLPNLAEWLPAL